ncbi:MAG: glycosyltransferase [Candidatus Gastranaerophilales bacterium]|nr:glycosyltransferase [Candidatus Gastranaerophilales bacterium]
MKISIITTSYNYAQYIEEAINSIINQIHTDWELIIVDDGSSDNSVEIIKSYCEKDKRIKLFQQPQNKGLKEALLLGVNNATGDWIAFLESDDIFAPDNLLKKFKIIEKYPKVKLIYNKVDFIIYDEPNSKRAKHFGDTQKKLAKKTFPKYMFYKFYINNQILTFSSVMIQAKLLKSIDFNTPVDTLLDWWLWIHAAYKNDFYYINEELTSWRLHEKSYISKKKRKIQLPLQVQAYWDVYKKNSKPKKLLFFITFSFILLFIVYIYRFTRKFLVEIIRRIKFILFGHTLKVRDIFYLFFDKK